MEELLLEFFLKNEIRKTSLYTGIALLMGLTIIIAYFFATNLQITEAGVMFLIPVLYASVSLGIWPSLIIACAALLAFDFFFMPPTKGFGIPNIDALIALGVFILVAIVCIILTDRLKNIAIESLKNVARLKTLYKFACELTAVTNIELLVTKVVAHIADDMKSEVGVFMSSEERQLEIAAISPCYQDYLNNSQEMEMAKWVYLKARSSDFGKRKYPLARGYYIPLQTDNHIIGVLGVMNPRRKFHTEQKILLQTMANLAALAIGRLRLAITAQEVKNYEQSERLLTALFNSISHDMKTPLSSIIGATTGLIENYDIYSPEQKETLLNTIQTGSLRMNRTIGNLLDMARLESGHMSLNIDWCDIQDMIGFTLRENQDLLREHNVKVNLPNNLPLVEADCILIEQVLINILDNSVKYCPTGSEIAISAAANDKELLVSITDQGDGIQPGQEKRIFDKFYRLQASLNVSGSGLGLSICKGIIEAHGGNIRAEGNEPNGTTITFSLPFHYLYRKERTDWKRW